jgi:hypothetical protein
MTKQQRRRKKRRNHQLRSIKGKGEEREDAPLIASSQLVLANLVPVESKYALEQAFS